MILILSTDGDASTNDVINWLYHNNEIFFRLNDNDILKYEFHFQLNENEDLFFNIKTERGNLHSNDISIVWLRKFGYYSAIPNFNLLHKKYGGSLIQQIKSEYFGALNLILLSLRNKKWFMKPTYAEPDKINVLSHAVKVGLKIPYTTIVNSKEGLMKALQNHNMITKSLKDCHSFVLPQHFVTMYTTSIFEDIVDNIPEIYMPSLIQERQEKEYEIRIFYIDKLFYSMIIFSQNDTQTKEDFRKYNWTKPNRNVPYKLPKEIENKLTQLMINLNIETGSIDMIYTIKNEYVFLEVNPCGQFGMVSKPCNYRLEEIIANYLSKLKNEKIQ